MKKMKQPKENFLKSTGKQWKKQKKLELVASTDISFQLFRWSINKQEPK